MAGLAAPAALAQRDITLAAASRGAVLLVALLTIIDLIDGSLGMFTSVGVLMASVSVPLSVTPSQLWATVLAPPLLLIGVLTLAVVIDPAAVAPEGMPESAGRFGRVLAGTVDRGITLAVAETFTLAALGLRRLALR
ncbi:hypothetical protein [Aeromicrobium alkaliterrae]|uniref:Uncharacterized protein n=1 Tax=Aeromicrobium alkaliterrae TaxID=302168 RepID=A0ABN2JGB3_9ACTN